jgi:hypothetical protein
MAVTSAKKVGLSAVPGIGHMAIYKITPDTSWLAAGEELDLTDDFSEVTAAWFGGCTVINGYKFDVILPADGTDIAADTVLITAHRSAATAAAFAAVPDATNLSTLAELRLIVVGKPSDPPTS